MTNQPENEEIATKHEEKVGQGSEALIHTLKVLFTCLRILMIIVFIYLPFSGVFRLDQQQNAMLFRFGKLIEKGGQEILTPGVWYWAFPAPIDKVEKMKALKTETLYSYNYWPRKSNVPLTTKEGKMRDDLKEINNGQDGYLLTGDSYIMHMAWSISYKIISPKNYFLNYAGVSENDQSAVEKLLLALLDDSVLKEVGSWSVDDVIKRHHLNSETGIVETLTQAVKRRLLTQILSLNPSLGIELQEVNLLHVAPPVSLSEAFSGVLTADQDQARMIQDARTYEVQMRSEAQSSAVHLVTTAQIAKERMIAISKAKAENFNIVLEKYKKNPKVTLNSLYTEAIREMLMNCGEKYKISADNNNDDIRIMMPRGKKETKRTVAPLIKE